MDATRQWIRNVSDERAVANGCRFDVLRGAQSVWWIERYCKLYEGEGYAGKPLVMWGCQECDYSELTATMEEWYDGDSPGIAQEIHAERAAKHAECVAAGHRIDWQYEFAMRCFGWERYWQKWDKFLRRFRRGSVWLPKKQKKSPSLAATSLYVFCGDGEPGQHVYLLAKDGAQAKKIAGEHAFQMVDQSPDLRSECKPNLNEKSLYHFGTRSKWEPLSSSNARTQQSKEGLNGSAFVDEAHVVDRAFINRTDRMGISRAEPLFLSFSTAGNNPDGWGHEEFQYAEKVIDGRVTNEQYLAIIYAAPQDLSDEELDRNFDHYARMANPSMGHTIDPEEIRQDYERSKETIEKLAEFKMYRLNVWQHSSNPWLRASDWARCAVRYTEADLLGQTCYGAFDLSLRWDTTAWILLFPNGETEDGQPKFRIWPRFFLPEKSAQKTKDKVPWFDWEKRGFITLTDGDTTDFPLVRRTIVEASKKFDLRTIAYDDRFAEYLAQALQDEDGLELVDFNQSITNFAEPMGLFESDVISGRIEHPDNACLNWQAGNATKNRKGMLVKPESDDVKKVDGVVSAVMARAMAAEGAKTEGYWNPADGVFL